MDFVKLKTTYYLDAALMRAGEAAEVLFLRAMAYAGDQESDGVIPREAVNRLTPTKGLARARALVREGLWEEIPEGWRFTTWHKHQETKDSMERRREAGRERQARYRERHLSRRNASRNAVTNASVTGTEEEEEVDAAAAAAREAPNHRAGELGLPAPIAVFSRKLRAHTPLAGIRFDTLTADQATRLHDLIARHGDQRLVDVAIASCRNPAPVFVTAFLGTWEALADPGQRLTVVRQTCPTHGTTLTSSGTCTSCAADQKAAR